MDSTSCHADCPANPFCICVCAVGVFPPPLKTTAVGGGPSQAPPTTPGLRPLHSGGCGHSFYAVVSAGRGNDGDIHTHHGTLWHCSPTRDPDWSVVCGGTVHHCALCGKLLLVVRRVARRLILLSDNICCPHEQ